jgi:hypothetical protein
MRNRIAGLAHRWALQVVATVEINGHDIPFS